MRSACSPAGGRSWSPLGFGYLGFVSVGAAVICFSALSIAFGAVGAVGVVALVATLIDRCDGNKSLEGNLFDEKDNCEYVKIVG